MWGCGGVCLCVCMPEWIWLCKSEYKHVSCAQKPNLMKTEVEKMATYTKPSPLSYWNALQQSLF